MVIIYVWGRMNLRSRVLRLPQSYPLPRSEVIRFPRSHDSTSRNDTKIVQDPWLVRNWDDFGSKQSNLPSESPVDNEVCVSNLSHLEMAIFDRITQIVAVTLSRWVPQRHLENGLSSEYGKCCLSRLVDWFASPWMNCRCRFHSFYYRWITQDNDFQADAATHSIDEKTCNWGRHRYVFN